MRGDGDGDGGRALRLRAPVKETPRHRRGRHATVGERYAAKQSPQKGQRREGAKRYVCVVLRSQQTGRVKGHMNMTCWLEFVQFG